METPSIPKPPIPIHKTFAPPVDNPKEYIYTGDDPASDDLDDISSDGGDISGGPITNQVLPPPENIHIVKQTIHQVLGTTVDDVTFGFDDVDGATSYELRIAKI